MTRGKEEQKRVNNESILTQNKYCHPSQFFWFLFFVFCFFVFQREEKKFGAILILEDKDSLHDCLFYLFMFNLPLLHFSVPVVLVSAREGVDVHVFVPLSVKGLRKKERKEKERRK